jgi:uncharacterized protein (DUF2235 family)
MANLIVCSDGTWNTPDDMKNGVPTPTNVWKIHNALADLDATKTAQKKYYHPGVGTDGSWWNKLVGGGTGEGLNRNIKSAYHWLAKTYRRRDKIYLFGFSRGAYTVRCLGGMIVKCGLLDLSDPALTPVEAWERVDLAFKCYREKSKPNSFTADFEKLPFHNRANASDSPAGTTKIHFIGVWDTVGALGIPDDMALLNLIDNLKDHTFADAELSDSVLNARHAIAIDEQRQSFTPTFWTNTENRNTVKQVWFPGVHSDVGGGYAQVGLSDGALKWMVDEASKLGLRFRPGVGAQLKPDSGGILHDSWSGIFKALKACPRNVPNLEGAAAKIQFHPSALRRFKNPPIQQGAYWRTVNLRVGASKEFDIFASQQWNATGLFLAEGGTYEMSASGEWLDSHIKCGPGGTNDGKFYVGEVAQMASSALGMAETLFRKATGNQQADFWWTKRIEDIPWFALVGVVANGSGADEQGNPKPHTTFKIGDSTKHTVKLGEAGYLYCFANDAWQAYRNNSGSVTLTVKRTK